MKLIENIQAKNVKPDKSAAMYYKTEPFFSDISRYVHTNNWEIYRAIEILTSMQFSVDLIDRGCHDWQPKKEYDLFLGLGVGNSGKNFANYSSLSKAKKRVLLSMGPQPDVSNSLVLKRYEMFNNRTGNIAPPMRTVELVTGENFNKIIENTDYIFNIGENNSCSYKSFLNYKKPVLNFYPGISPSVTFNADWLKTRDTNSFLCFAGNGFICKGVDLLVEAFLNMPNKNLHICGPSSEGAFFNYYNSKIENSNNIHYHGFIKPGSDLFNSLSSKCAYVIFHSAAEGCCTSVATAMKAGLVPIINPWTGIVIEDNVNGMLMSEEGNLIKVIEEKVNYAANITNKEYSSLVENNNKHSELFSQDSFTKSYADALNQVFEGSLF